ncbi:hypothetical protein [Clostridium sulfidigenes]|uniref:hypothetical protein n=1 Tax=Clostridium sulfidigenes TaxID=318464 RepID=UPI003F8A1605
MTNKIGEFSLPSKEELNNMMELSRVSQMNELLRPQRELEKQINEVSKEIALKRKEKEDREIRNLEISEERLEYDKLKVFLLQSVNKEQKEMLEKVDSLLDTIEFGNKVGENNLEIIQQELLNIKQSTNNLNESFIKLIEKKMMEMGVEAAVKYFFIGIKELFLKP